MGRATGQAARPRGGPRGQANLGPRGVSQATHSHPRLGRVHGQVLLSSDGSTLDL